MACRPAGQATVPLGPPASRVDKQVSARRQLTTRRWLARSSKAVVTPHLDDLFPSCSSALPSAPPRLLRLLCLPPAALARFSRLPLQPLELSAHAQVAALAHPLLACGRVAAPFGLAVSPVSAALQAPPPLLLVEAGGAHPLLAGRWVRPPGGVSGRPLAVAAAAQAAHAHGAQLPPVAAHVVPAGLAQPLACGGVAVPPAARLRVAVRALQLPLLLQRRLRRLRWLLWRRWLWLGCCRCCRCCCRLTGRISPPFLSW